MWLTAVVRPLGDEEHPLLHVVGSDGGEVPDDAGDGDVDVGEDVGRHALGGDHAQHDDEQRDDDEGVGTAEGEPNDSHGGLALRSARARPGAHARVPGLLGSA